MGFIKWLFVRTRPEERNWRVATVVGLIAGLCSVWVKWGAEHTTPPRLPDTMAPPVAIAQHWFGLVDPMYTFMGTGISWGALVHGFMSIVLVLIYVWLSEVFPRVRLWQGVAYGICAAIGAHFIAIPAMGLSGWPWELPAAASVSELISHAITFLIADQICCGIRAKITGKPYPSWEGM